MVFSQFISKVYTQTFPADHAIELMKQIIFEHKDRIWNGDFILDLLNVVLKNSLMQFRQEFFQQIFGVIMGTNVTPIVANIYIWQNWKKSYKKNVQQTQNLYGQYVMSDSLTMVLG